MVYESNISKWYRKSVTLYINRLSLNIGIFTYGTGGDVQPYIALALGLTDKGHRVMIAAPENFKDLVEGYGIAFHPLYGNVEEKMNSPEGQSVLRTENTIMLMKYFFKVLHE